jgi:ribosomal protein S12 methylthiotransferase accessory factor
VLWTEARDLVTGRALFVPYELVSADMTVPAPAGFGVFQQTTNGLGGGGALAEAILHGLYEAVERDAVARWLALADSERAARCVDPASVDGPASRWLLARLAAAGAPVRLWDITTEIGLPAWFALTWDPDGVAGIEPEAGYGCHASADVALARALAEAAQARLTRISGARDDFSPASYAPAARAERQAAAERMARMAPARGFRAVPRGATARADLEAALAALGRAGHDRVACLDLTRPEFGIPIARVIVPGLRGPVEDARPGRAAAAA